jgi:cell division protease FtsH
MVVQYGMSSELGPVTYERDQRSFLGGMAMPADRAYADSTATTIDREVHDIAGRAVERAVAVLTERRILLDATARKLLAQETLEAGDITAIATEMQVPA